MKTMLTTILKDYHPSRPALVPCIDQNLLCPGQPIQFNSDKFPCHLDNALQLQPSHSSKNFKACVATIRSTGSNFRGWGCFYAPSHGSTRPLYQYTVHEQFYRLWRDGWRRTGTVRHSTGISRFCVFVALVMESRGENGMVVRLIPQIL